MKGRLRARLHIDEARQAMIADGRSQAPPLPVEYRWIFLTAAINRRLGCSYAIEEVQTLPGDQLALLEALFEVEGGRHG